MTDNAELVLKSIRNLLSDKKLPSGVDASDIQEQTGLNNQLFIKAVDEITKNYSTIIPIEGSNTYTYISVSVGFE